LDVVENALPERVFAAPAWIRRRDRPQERGELRWLISPPALRQAADGPSR
jgi:hypothetical protein